MTKTATYTFEEAIERIRICTDYWELKMLAEIIVEEKWHYSPFHLELISTAVAIMKNVVAR